MGMKNKSTAWTRKSGIFVYFVCHPRLPAAGRGKQEHPELSRRLSPFLEFFFGSLIVARDGKTVIYFLFLRFYCIIILLIKSVKIKVKNDNVKCKII